MAELRKNPLTREWVIVTTEPPYFALVGAHQRKELRAYPGRKFSIARVAVARGIPLGLLMGFGY